MVVTYGCNVSNRFGNLPENEDFGDPNELVEKLIVEAAEKKAAAKIAPVKEAPKVSPPAEKENRPASGGERGRGGRGRGRGAGGRPRDFENNGENRTRGGPRRGGERGGARPFRGRGGAFNAGSNDESQVAGIEGSPESAVDGERPRRGGRGGGFRGGRGGRGGRPFDRQSGSDRTGVRATDKKEGHGKGNWGDDKDELTGATEDVAADEPQVPEEPKEKTQEQIEYEEALAAFEKMKTLKEFKASQENEKPTFNIRKAGEGESEKFGKLVPLKKEVIPDREEDEVVVIKRESKKQIINLDFKFQPSNRGGPRERGERGERPHRGAPRGRGGRGGAGRGGQRPSGPSGPGFDASLEAFPALGSK